MFRHVGIVVENLESQLNFYQNYLGLEIISNELENGIFLESILNINSVEIQVIKLGKFNKTIVELLNYKTSDVVTNKKINQNGITHFALTVENIDILYQKLIDLNCCFLSRPLINKSGTHKVCFLKDFENNFIELVEEL